MAWRGVIACLLMALVFRLPASAAGIAVLVDGKLISLSPAPTIVHDHVFVPLRGVLERLGAAVSYANRKIDITSGGDVMELTVGVPSVSVNGESRPLDDPPFLSDGYVFVPLYVIAVFTGADVTWNGEAQTVSIVTPPTPPPTPAPTPAPTSPPSQGGLEVKLGPSFPATGKAEVLVGARYYFEQYGALSTSAYFEAIAGTQLRHLGFGLGADSTTGPLYFGGAIGLYRSSLVLPDDPTSNRTSFGARLEAGVILDPILSLELSHTFLPEILRRNVGETDLTLGFHL
ncbi:MAG TPA: copper amine oxidase N-terminal domain-containing protein [Candidatus Eremiobacteraceae bacterium]|nr:copper amine oxidase N-terminal domain-containing protein [Candidatus Eremiobacteraceae bacterium]